MNCKVTREQIEDLKNTYNIEFIQDLELQLIEELSNSISRNIIMNYPLIKKYKQVFNEIDPYGEEEWEDD